MRQMSVWSARFSIKMFFFFSNTQNFDVILCFQCVYSYFNVKLDCFRSMFKYFHLYFWSWKIKCCDMELQQQFICQDKRFKGKRRKFNFLQRHWLESWKSARTRSGAWVWIHTWSSWELELLCLNFKLNIEKSNMSRWFSFKVYMYNILKSKFNPKLFPFGKWEVLQEHLQQHGRHVQPWNKSN